jgi:hypothetical protein
MTAMMIRIMVRVVIRAVVIIITTVIIWIWIIIIWIVRGCVIIWFRMGLLAAFRTGYSILRKNDPTNRIGVQEMVFPSLNGSPVNSPISDKRCSPPQRDYFFLRHVRFNIKSMTRVA